MNNRYITCTVQRLMLEVLSYKKLPAIVRGTVNENSKVDIVIVCLSLTRASVCNH